ncbi:MAG: restriction endonuclease [Candidatus Delongbacteria bacterium]|nr:restriction endonuclease [Candidatus Delongbacteria bacterium]
MQYLKTYLQQIINSGNEKLAESILKTADEIGDKYIREFSFISHEVGLLFGNIQSGKTGQTFGIICKAADLGFPVFLLLTTDNVALQQQTLERIKNDLDGFCICSENDSALFIDNSLVRPTIVVLKKNARILRLWANVFNSTGFMKGNPLFIIDDEGDAASLNTLINRNGQSTINKYLDSIKDGATSSLYLQVTGTPQAILLQTLASGWHPYFTYYFSPGESYLGGDFFFPSNSVPRCINFLETIKQPNRKVVIQHLIVSAQILASGGKVSNCLLHPSVRQAVHQRFADYISNELLWCSEHINDELITELQKYYNTLLPEKSDKMPFGFIYETIKDLVDKKRIKILIMNGKTEVEGSEYAEGCNFIIGGNTLGRGITFPSLQTIYYTRTSKKPQADTVWQHSRMFGYDRDAGMMNIFIDEQLYKLFADINSTNNAIIAQTEQGLENIKIYYPVGLSPTRKNVLDNKYVEILSGGTNYYPFYPDNSTIEDISKLLEPFSEDEPYYQVNLRMIKQILSHIIPSSDFKLNSFISVIDTILSEQPAGQGILLVRRKRDIKQGTGALLSPNDWQLGGSFSNKVVLTMYQVTGTKGWKGKKLWIPNIKLPHDIIYYDVNSEDVHL